MNHFLSFKLKQLLSYFQVQLIEKRKSAISGILEVNLVNGHYTLDTPTVNYSFGGLNTVFLKTFNKYLIKNRKAGNILILGFGAGNVMKLLTQFNIRGMVDGVEKDAEVIDLARKYFKTEQYGNLRLINEDAMRYVNTCKEKYDLVIIDLYVNNEVPYYVESDSFLIALTGILSADGIIFYNKIVDSQKTRKEAESFIRLSSKIISKPTLFIVKSNGMSNWVFLFKKLFRDNYLLK